MNPIILHIGAPKTGTSSLQRFLADHAVELAAGGVVYPSAGRGAGGLPAHHNLSYEKHDGRRASGVFKPEAGTWADALAEIDAVDGGLGVVSSEAFLIARPIQAGRIRAVLRGRTVTIVAYVRRQDLWLQSAWNQLARFGRCSLDFWDFYLRSLDRGSADYHRQLAPWAESFGPERMVIRNFDTLPAGGIVPDFMSCFVPRVGAPLGGSADGNERRNTRAGLKQLVAVSLIVDECRSRLGPDFSLPSSSAARIAGYFRDRSGETTAFSVISFDQANEIYQTFVASNTALAELSPSFGDDGGFPPPRPEQYENPVDLATMGIDSLTSEERRFVTRMAREIVRAHVPQDP